MLIEMIKCDPSDYKNDPDRRDAVENLFKMSYESKNLLLADREICNQVLRSNLYSESSRNHSASLQSYRMEIKNKLDFLLYKLVVDFSKENENYFFYSKGEKHVSYKVFTRGIDFVLPIFVAENYLDYDMYQYIAKAFLKNNNLNSHLNLFYEKVPGGGSQSKTVYDRKKSEKNSVLAILDSDKKHPRFKEGSTSGVFDINDRDEKNISYSYIVPVHELENLIPFDILKCFVEDSAPHKKEFIDNFDSYISHIKDSEMYSYFDFKEGIDLKKAIEIDSVYGRFWLELFEKNVDLSNFDCVSELKCSDCGKCVSVIGFGDNVLRKTIDIISKKNSTLIYKGLNESLREKWDKISLHIISFSCSNAIKSKAS